MKRDVIEDYVYNTISTRSFQGQHPIALITMPGELNELGVREYIKSLGGKIVSHHGVEDTIEDLHLTASQFNDAVSNGIFSVLSPDDVSGLSTAPKWEAAAKQVTSIPFARNQVVFGSTAADNFVKEIAVSLASAKVFKENLAIEKYISVNSDENDLYVSAIKVVSAFGGSAIVTKDAVFIVHTHAVDLRFPKSQDTVGPEPGPRDADVVKILGIPNYVVSYRYNAKSFSLRHIGIIEVGESLNKKGIGYEDSRKIKTQ